MTQINTTVVIQDREYPALVTYELVYKELGDNQTKVIAEAEIESIKVSITERKEIELKSDDYDFFADAVMLSTLENEIIELETADNRDYDYEH